MKNELRGFLFSYEGESISDSLVVISLSRERAIKMLRSRFLKFNLNEWFITEFSLNEEGIIE